MSDVARYRAAFDEQLRIVRIPVVAEAWLGPLQLVTLERGHGLVAYQDLEGVPSADFPSLVSAALDHFRGDPTIQRVDWKTCAHDHDAGLQEALLENGFTLGAQESIMVGESSALAVEVMLPDGVTLRRITSEEDVMASEEMQGEVFGDPDWRRRVAVMLHQLGADPGMEMWVAEAEGRVVTAGRLEPVAGTDFANLLGGATRPEWRRRGIYRALTAARARSALAQGKSLIHSSSTEFSRPVLERSGLIKVSTATFYGWQSARLTTAR